MPGLQDLPNELLHSIVDFLRRIFPATGFQIVQATAPFLREVVHEALRYKSDRWPALKKVCLCSSDNLSAYVEDLDKSPDRALQRQIQFDGDRERSRL